MSVENPFQLEGKTILITGASSGIGREAAITITRNGGNVIITGRNQQRLQETYHSLERDGHLSFEADLTDLQEITSIADQLPELDGIVFSSGITGHLPAKFIGENDITSFFRINYQAPVLLTSRILKNKKLKNKASVIFLSSVASRFPYYGGALYASTKAALEAYSRVLAIELAPKGIRSNCISSSFVKTQMRQGAAVTISEEVLQKFEKMMPLGFGETADVANAIIFLLSDASRWVTGTNLILGGG